MGTTRLTINIDEELKRRVQIKALKDNETVTQIIIKKLKKWLKEPT